MLSAVKCDPLHDRTECAWELDIRPYRHLRILDLSLATFIFLWGCALETRLKRRFLKIFILTLVEMVILKSL